MRGGRGGREGNERGSEREREGGGKLEGRYSSEGMRRGLERGRGFGGQYHTARGGVLKHREKRKVGLKRGGEVMQETFRGVRWCVGVV